MPGDSVNFTQLAAALLLAATSRIKKVKIRICFLLPDWRSIGVQESSGFLR
jgi:hypothetical protein